MIQSNQNQPESYEQKFSDFIEMCNKAKQDNASQVLIRHPSVLGDTYEEIIESHEKDVLEGKRKQRDLSHEIEALRNKAIKRFPIGTLSPSTAVTLERFPIPETNEMDFFVMIHTRAGYFTQSIVQKKFGSVWKSSWRVLRHEKNGDHKILKEQISAEVPIKE